MLTRRDWLTLTAGAGAALTLNPKMLFALQAQPLIKRAIPSSGEEIPIIGLGSSATFAQIARQEDLDAVRGVLDTLVKEGGTVFDTAPSYGASEEVAGRVAAELGHTERIFWATKVNVAGRGNNRADPAAARAQIDTSFSRLKKNPIDLIQVHNLGDVPTQLGILKELKAEGRIRYIGVTSTSEQQYPELERIMQSEPLDFIGVDYAIDNREVENRILPLAQERKIGVLVYLPFGRTRLWSRVKGREVPEWAKEFDATTWAQFFLKFIAAHPAVTCITPATSQPRNMADNIGGGRGRLPDEAMRKRMVELVDSLPSA
ncbi:MAG: aldo/keto reductase [Acidobacteriota bacterium]|nr:MAG: aldo/keto reductase [Acidobacteriota bacterium]